MILSTYSYLYFITSKFSIYGFSVYKKVFFSVLDQIIENNDSKEIINLVKNIELDINVEKPHEKCRVVYYLLVIEQLVKVLDDDYLEKQVLPMFDRYPFMMNLFVFFFKKKNRFKKYIVLNIWFIFL